MRTMEPVISVVQLFAVATSNRNVRINIHLVLAITRLKYLKRQPKFSLFIMNIHAFVVKFEGHMGQ